MVDLPVTEKRPRVVEHTHTPPTTWWAGHKFDILALILPLALLAIDVLLVARTGFIPFPGSGRDSLGDYYRYINMALPNCTGFSSQDCNYFFAHDDPFVFRILVPLTVHGLILIGVPFRVGFFSLMSLSLILDAIGMYVLARGANVSRGEAMFAAATFSTLLWAVAFNVHEFYLVDPETYVFIVWILVACQQRRYWMAGVLTVVGVLCKESMLIATALAATQLLMTYWSPLPARVNDVMQGRFKTLVQLVPRQQWVQFLFLIAGGIGTYLISRQVIVSANHLSTFSVWRHYIEGRLNLGIKTAVWDFFSMSGWGTYGIMLAWAAASLVLGAWRKARWSGWAWLAATLIWGYGYTVSGDWQRVSINGWPLALLLAALGIHEVSQRWRVSPLLLWGITLGIQIAYQPVMWTYDKTSLNNMYGPVSPISLAIGGPLVGIGSLLIAIAVVVILFLPQFLPKKAAGR
jgi:hypothetical protein